MDYLRALEQMSTSYPDLNLITDKFTKFDVDDPTTITKYKLGEDAKNQGDTEAKVNHNVTVIRWVCFILMFIPNALFIYLEGDKSRTSRMALDAGISPNNCIPINCDVNIANEIKKYVPHVMSEYYANVMDLLDTRAYSRVRVVWYDGCATLLGNDTICPLDDIKKTLHLIQHDFLLVLTFSTRGNKNTKSKMIDIVDEITGKLKKIRQVRKKPYKSGSGRRGMSAKRALCRLHKVIDAAGFSYKELMVEQYKKGMMFWMSWMYKN